MNTVTRGKGGRFQAARQAAMESTAPVMVPEEKFRIVTSGEQGEFEAYQTLTTVSDIAAYLRGIMAEAIDDVDMEKLNATDDDMIVDIARSIPYHTTEGEDKGGSTEWELEVCNAIQSRLQTNAPITPPITSRELPDTRSTIDVRISAGSIARLEAARFDADPDFKRDLIEASKGPEITKMAGLKMLLHTLRLCGVTIAQKYAGALSSYEIVRDEKGNVLKKDGYITTHFPDPDSKPLNSKGEINRDYRVRKDEWQQYATHYRMIGTDKVLYDWYKDFVDGTEYGHNINLRLNDLNRGKKKQKGEREGPFKSARNTWIKGQVRLEQDRVNAMVRAMKVAFGAYFQMQDIVAKLPNVGCGFEMIRNPLRANNPELPEYVVTDGTEPILIWDKEEGGNTQCFTVSGFNNLDVDKAIADCNNDAASVRIGDLMETTGRGASETGDDEGLDWKPESFLNRLPGIWEFLRSTHNTAQLMNETNKRDKERRFTVEADDTFILLYEVAQAMLPFYSTTGKAERYLEITNRRNKAEQEELAKRDPNASGERKTG